MSEAPAPLSVSIDEACELTGVGRTHMYGLIAAGDIATMRSGRRRLVNYASLAAWVEHSTASAA